jgi:phosphoribosylanthranilate isomerase
MTTKLKICGLTQKSQAMQLSEMGVDFLGFILVPSSPRFIALEESIRIASEIKFSQKVAVVQNPSLELVKSIEQAKVFEYIQLHGAETPEFMEQISLPMIQVMGVSSEGALSREIFAKAHFLLFDTLAKGLRGGTGEEFDWSVVSKHSWSKPYFLAGGLGPHNLKEAILKLNPFAVDLNSLVEVSPGVKDLNKIQSCLDILRILA